MESFVLEQLGLVLQNAGNAINDRIARDGKNIETTQVVALSNRAQELFMKSTVLFAKATIALGAEAKQDLERLQAADQEIAQAINTIASVQKAIGIAAKLIGVAGHLLAGEIKDAAQSAKDIVQDLRS
jgi:hypothetical protein